MSEVAQLIPVFVLLIVGTVAAFIVIGGGVLWLFDRMFGYDIAPGQQLHEACCEPDGARLVVERRLSPTLAEIITGNDEKYRP